MKKEQIVRAVLNKFKDGDTVFMTEDAARNVVDFILEYIVSDSDLTEQIAEGDINAVARFYGATVEEIKSRSRDKHLVDARSVLFKRLRTHYGLSIVKAGKILNRHHATVIHCSKRDVCFERKLSWVRDYEKIFKQPKQASNPLQTP